jgi:hypothetical protein
MGAEEGLIRKGRDNGNYYSGFIACRESLGIVSIHQYSVIVLAQSWIPAECTRNVNFHLSEHFAGYGFLMIMSS